MGSERDLPPKGLPPRDLPPTDLFDEDDTTDIWDPSASSGGERGLPRFRPGLSEDEHATEIHPLSPKRPAAEPRPPTRRKGLIDEDDATDIWDPSASSHGELRRPANLTGPPKGLSDNDATDIWDPSASARARPVPKPPGKARPAYPNPNPSPRPGRNAGHKPGRRPRGLGDEDETEMWLPPLMSETTDVQLVQSDTDPDPAYALGDFEAAAEAPNAGVTDFDEDDADRPARPPIGPDPTAFDDDEVTYVAPIQTSEEDPDDEAVEPGGADAQAHGAAEHNAPGTEEAWRGLHPASLLINLLPQMWRTARGLWPLILLLIVGGQSSSPEGSLGLELTLLVTFFLLSIARTVVHFLTLRYRLQSGRLEIRSGLLNRRSRVLDPNRIQNMELAQNPFHKIAGLVELRIETAGDTSTEGMLSALDVSEAERLKAALEQLVRARSADPDAEPDAVGEALLENSIVELLAYGLSKRRIGTVALLFAVGMEALTYLDPTQTQQVVEEITAGRLIGAILLAFSGTLIFSGGQAIVQHYGFTLKLRDDRLISQEGLLTRRRVEIPRGKVQLIRVDEPWLRRQMGFGTMFVETAALGMADGDVRQAEGVLPMVSASELSTVVKQAAPVADVDPWAVPLRPAHPRALYRAFIRGLARSTALSVVLILALPWPYAFAALALIPLSLPVAWLDWKKQGWLVTPKVILARRGYLKRQTWVIARNKLQSVHMVQTPLMRWHGLVSVAIDVAGSEVRLPEVGLETGHEILEELRQTWLPPTPSSAVE